MGVKWRVRWDPVRVREVGEITFSWERVRGCSGSVIVEIVL